MGIGLRELLYLMLHTNIQIRVTTLLESMPRQAMQEKPG